MELVSAVVMVVVSNAGWGGGWSSDWDWAAAVAVASCVVVFANYATVQKLLMPRCH